MACFCPIWISFVLTKAAITWCGDWTGSDPKSLLIIFSTNKPALIKAEREDKDVLLDHHSVYQPRTHTPRRLANPVQRCEGNFNALWFGAGFFGRGGGGFFEFQIQRLSMWSPLPFTAGRWIYSSVLFQLKKRARRVNRFSPKHPQEEVETLCFPFKGPNGEDSQTDTFEWALIWWMIFFFLLTSDR